MRPPRGTYFVIDIECNGPVPGLYDMVSLGAVCVHNRDGRAASGESLYLEMRPQAPRFDSKAAAIHGLDQNRLHREGLPRAEACRRLAAWVKRQCDPHTHAIFVGHNAPFDWSFVNYAFVAENIPNPFGYKALDTRALAMGVLGTHWLEASKEKIQGPLNLPPEDKHTKHRADADAAYQAKILIALLNRISVQP